MKIGDVARAAGTSVRAIRHYEKVGLISATRGANGYRAFDADAVLLVRRIGRMIRLGFTTAEIATFLDCIVDDPAKVTACESVARAHRKKLGEIERQIADLESRRDKLLVTLKAASGLDPSVPETLPHADAKTSPLRSARHAGARRLSRRYG
jgi:DNA-binding transcriptional MerR regulator